MITQPAPTMRASADADPRPEALDAAAARRRAGDGDASDVVLDGLWRRLGDVQALAGMSLTVPAGTLVALLGPSGCGKTTALRVLAGLEDLDAGAVRIAGRDVSHVPAHRRDNAMVFQAFSLMPHMTAGENVAFALELRGVPRRARAAIVDEHLELVGLGSHRDRYAHQLSGGQQQRVALARALAVRPSVLLLDEPLSALDAKVRVSLRDEIRRIQSQTGITTLFVTHDQEEALDLADRVVILNKGRIVQEGTPEAVCRNPADAFVMNFLGDANRLDADIRGGKAYVEDVAFEAEGVADGGGQILFRPADVTWREDGKGIAAKIVRVIDRPDSRRVLAMTGSGQPIEFDTAPEFPHRKGEAGFIDIRRPRVYAAA